MITTNKYRVGMSGDPANNFDLEPDGAGSLLIKRVSTGLVHAKIDANGNLLGKAPSFRALPPTGSHQNLPTNIYTKVNLTRVSGNVGAAFANSRFTAGVPGWYQVSGTVSVSSTVSTLLEIIGSIYLNGAEYSWASVEGGKERNSVSISDLVYLNGTTDYIELYAWSSGASQNIWNVRTHFSGHLVSATL